MYHEQIGNNQNSYPADFSPENTVNWIKVITAMSAAVLVLSCGMTAFAAEANLSTDTEQKDIGAYVKYVDNTVWNAGWKNASCLSAGR